MVSNYFIILLVGIFTSQALTFILSNIDFMDYIQNNPPTPLLKYILLILFIVSIIPWLLRKKGRIDYVILYSVLIFSLIQNLPISDINFTWLPIGKFLTSWQTQIMFYSLWIVWPWQNFFHNLFENSKAYKFTIMLIIISFFIILSIQLGYRYYTFSIPGHDFALFNQAIANYEKAEKISTDYLPYALYQKAQAHGGNGNLEEKTG